jgi:hypothetical protein
MIQTDIGDVNILINNAGIFHCRDQNYKTFYVRNLQVFVIS